MPKGVKYRKWSEDDLRSAIAAKRDGSMGANEIFRKFGISKSTLKRHMEPDKPINEPIKSLGRPCIFTVDMESDLKRHIIQFEERMFGLTIHDVRRLAFQVADSHGIGQLFNQEKQMAGKKWYYSFMRRNPGLSLRQPEATSIARIRGFSRERVSQFYDILEQTVDKYKLDGTKIFNVDESGFTTVQKKPQKVIGQKGKARIAAVTSGERGVNTLIVCCTSAAGVYVPPMIVYKGKRHDPALGIGAPIGSVIKISDAVYITSQLFCEWLHHFHSHIPSSRESPVLLLLDGHTTHSKNLDALIFARDNGIIILQLPSHTTHRMQPLDVAFFKPLGTYYIQAQEKWLRQNVGERITKIHVSGLLAESYGRAGTVEIAQNAFRGSGIWPVDRNVFKDHDFVASDALLPQQPLVNSPMEENQFQNTLNAISPLPQQSVSTQPQGNRNNSKIQDASVLTSTPYKDKLQNDKLTKENKEKTLQEKRLKRKIFSDGVTRRCKKKPQ